MKLEVDKISQFKQIDVELFDFNFEFISYLFLEWVSEFIELILDVLVLWVELEIVGWEGASVDGFPGL